MMRNKSLKRPSLLSWVIATGLLSVSTMWTSTAFSQQLPAAAGPSRVVVPHIPVCNSNVRYYRYLNDVSRRKYSVRIRDDYDEHIKKYAQQAGFDWLTIKALIAVESNFNPVVKSEADAYGLLQMRPPTIRDAMVRVGFSDAKSLSNQELIRRYLSNTELQIKLGVSHLKWLRDNYEKGDRLKGINSYNAGHAFAVAANKKNLSAIDYMLWVGESPYPHPETLQYGVKIGGVLRALGGNHQFADDALICKALERSASSNETGRNQINASNATNTTGKRMPVPEGCSFIYPLDTRKSGNIYRVTSAWGMRKKPNGISLHAGTDIGTPVGVPVLAAQSGYVKVKLNPNDQQNAGTYMTIYDPETRRRSVYMHLSRLNTNHQTNRQFTNGDVVSAGTPIAFTGDTGAGGPHLHYGTALEVPGDGYGEMGGKNTVDPTKYTCPNEYGGQFTAADKSHRGSMVQGAINYYGGQDAWMQATLQRVGWHNGMPTTAPGEKDFASLDMKQDDGGPIGVRSVMSGGGDSSVFAEYYGYDDAVSTDSFMFYLSHQISERMSPDYYKGVAGASLERLWAELAYTSALKFHIQAAMDEEAKHAQAVTASRMSLMNQRVNGGDIANMRRENARLVSGK